MRAVDSTKRRSSLTSMVLLLGWGALALFAVWRLLPTPAVYEPPAGWTRFAPSLAVQDMLISEERVLVAGIGGLYEIAPDGRERNIDLATVREFGTGPMLRALTKDAQGRIWAGHQYGLAILEGQNWTVPVFEGKDVPGAIRALTTDAEGNVWAGGERGLFHASPNSASLINVQLPQPDAVVTALMFDRENGLWAGSLAHGVFRLRNGTWSHWTAEQGLPHLQVTSFLNGKDGSVLCGTGFYNKGGVAVFRPDTSGQWQISSTLPASDFAGEKVRSLFEDGQGRLWLGHEYDGITIRQNDKTVRFVTAADGLPDPEVTLIRPDADGGLWIGTMKGLVRLSTAAVEKLILQNSGGAHES